MIIHQFTELSFYFVLIKYNFLSLKSFHPTTTSHFYPGPTWLLPPQQPRSSSGGHRQEEWDSPSKCCEGPILGQVSSLSLWDHRGGGARIKCECLDLNDELMFIKHFLLININNLFFFVFIKVFVLINFLLII